MYTKTDYVNGQAPGINATNLNNNEEATSQMDFTTQLTSGTSNAITITSTHPSMSRIPVEIPNDITGLITVNKNGEGAKNLEEYDGTQVNGLDAGLYEFYEKAGEFILMTSGGTIYDTPVAEAEGNFTVAATSTYEDIINIQKKGRLTSVTVREAATGTGKLRVTVDGTVIFENTFDGRVCGVVSEGGLVGYDSELRTPSASISASNTGYEGSALGAVDTVSYPHTVDTLASAVLIMGQPIVFKQSLQIEIQHSSTSTPISYTVRGEYKA